MRWFEGSALGIEASRAVLKRTPRSDMAELWIIDDDPADLELLAHAINRTAVDCDVRLFRSAKEASKAYASAIVRPRLAIVDWHLPPEGGQTFLQAVTRLGGSQPGLVVMSGRRTPAVVRKAYDAGATLFLQKPMTLKRLMALLNSLLRLWLEMAVPPPVQRAANNSDAPAAHRN